MYIYIIIIITVPPLLLLLIMMIIIYIYIYKCILYLIISPSHTINQYLDMSLFFKHFQPYKGDIGGSIFQDWRLKHVFQASGLCHHCWGLRRRYGFWDMMVGRRSPVGSRCLTAWKDIWPGCCVCSSLIPWSMPISRSVDAVDVDEMRPFAISWTFQVSI